MADESMDGQTYGASRSTTKDRAMHGKMKKERKGKALPIPTSLILMFGKPGGDKREKKLVYKNKKRKKDYEDEEEEEG